MSESEFVHRANSPVEAVAGAARSAVCAHANVAATTGCVAGLEGETRAEGLVVSCTVKHFEAVAVAFVETVEIVGADPVAVEVLVVIAAEAAAAVVPEAVATWDAVANEWFQCFALWNCALVSVAEPAVAGLTG